jgi:hypothetical protein
MYIAAALYVAVASASAMEAQCLEKRRHKGENEINNKKL